MINAIFNCVICITAGGAVAQPSQLEAGHFPVLSDQHVDTDHRNVVTPPPLLIEDMNLGRLSLSLKCLVSTPSFFQRAEKVTRFIDREFRQFKSLSAADAAQ